MKLPMREKYVDEAVSIYLVFGVHEDGTVDVSDNNARDIFIGLPLAEAEQVVAAQEEFRNRLYSILCTPSPTFELPSKEEHF